MMKYCKRCGAQLSDDAKFCSSCGASVKQESDENQNHEQPQPYSPYSTSQQNTQYTQYAPPYQPQKKKNGLSMAGFIVSLAGMLFLPLVSGIVGLVLSVIGLRNSKREGLGTDGFAIAGIIIGVINILYGILLIMICSVYWTEYMNYYFDPSTIDV
jgi:lipopolysaccharide export LptBFGC system permease protein LptF